MKQPVKGKMIGVIFLLTLLFGGLGGAVKSGAQTLSAKDGSVTLYNNQPWEAKWIAPPGINGHEYGVYHYRKIFEIAGKPASFPVKVSADNRYKLYVNGQLVSLGPARGDLHYWNYEQVDLAPYLKSGKNILAALVWNESDYSNEAQMTNRTGFILQGANKEAAVCNTDDSWRCIKDEAYRPLRYYFIAGPGIFMDMHKLIKGWKDPGFDDSSWPKGQKVGNGNPKGSSDGGWMLVPSIIPEMELTYQRIAVLRKVTGMPGANPANFEGFPGRKKSITIPANSHVTLLLDQTYLTNAYFTLKFSAGEGAAIGIGYAETLYRQPDPERDRNNFSSHPAKGNRNDIDGKFFTGMADSILSDGSKNQSFTSLFWRTYRYVELRIYTKAAPLTIEDVYGTFTGYPFKQNAHFYSNADSLQQILDIGWRTARLDAMETYMDCPYYEQLQYIGDTRIQAELSYFNSGDDRLARNALNLMDHSRLPEGVTMSRWPSHGTQIISTFSLWYIGMLHDYWMYRPDAGFVQQKLAGARQILNFFHQFEGKDGSLVNLPYWKFVDWVGGPGWTMGEAPKGSDGCSAMLDLQLLKAYQWEAAMEGALGMKAYEGRYQIRAERLAQTIKAKYWNQKKGLFADTREQNSYSQHVNAMAILAGLVDQGDLKDFGDKLLKDHTLVQCTIYFKYYLNQALVKAGLGDDYLNWLDIWWENIKMGLTTWAEDSNLQYARSDCHAWGASPNIEFYRTILGIDTDSPGFKTVRIEPHLGKLTRASGEIPHPMGKIKVDYRLDAKTHHWKADIELPSGTTGHFIWSAKSVTLKSGRNHFDL
jgi:hypothetical protein